MPHCVYNECTRPSEWRTRCTDLLQLPLLCQAVPTLSDSNWNLGQPARTPSVLLRRQQGWWSDSLSVAAAWRPAFPSIPPPTRRESMRMMSRAALAARCWHPKIAPLRLRVCIRPIH
ncbi:hypothetical protein KR074_009049 [Drosophila pseudoananassae]|nr:hypothetical protein KR074_009049 [Drosophila pseudoananassae]